MKQLAPMQCCVNGDPCTIPQSRPCQLVASARRAIRQKPAVHRATCVQVSEPQTGMVQTATSVCMACSGPEDASQHPLCGLSSLMDSPQHATSMFLPVRIPPSAGAGKIRLTTQCLTHNEFTDFEGLAWIPKSTYTGAPKPTCATIDYGRAMCEVAFGDECQNMVGLTPLYVVAHGQQMNGRVMGFLNVPSSLTWSGILSPIKRHPLSNDSAAAVCGAFAQVPWRFAT